MCGIERDCEFCQISIGESPKSVIVYQDENYIAFEDIDPSSKNHFLVIPRIHIQNAKSLTMDTIYKVTVQDMMSIGEQLIKVRGGIIEDSRIGFHWPPYNSVQHLHLHVIFPASRIATFRKMKYDPNFGYMFVTPETVIRRIKEKNVSASHREFPPNTA